MYYVFWIALELSNPNMGLLIKVSVQDKVLHALK